jgi:hypothetical protein
MRQDDTLEAQDSPFDIDVGEDDEDDEDDYGDDEDADEEQEEGEWQVGRGPAPA